MSRNSKSLFGKMPITFDRRFTAFLSVVPVGRSGVEGITFELSQHTVELVKGRR